MATKKRSRKDLYARLMSYIEDCGNEARSAIEEVMSEEYLTADYKREYRRKMRRVEALLEACTSNAVRWKFAIRSINLEYVIQLNALYKAMMSEFEYFEIRPNVVYEIEKEIKRLSQIKRWDPESCPYEKTMDDYCDSITTIAMQMCESKVLRKGAKSKYCEFDVHAWNAETREVFSRDNFLSNEVFNSYKLDSLTHKRSFSYIKNMVSLACKFPEIGENGYDCDLYLMSYTTPQAMVSVKINLNDNNSIYAEIRIFDSSEPCGYKEATVPIEMQTDMYKLYEQFGFSMRQRRDASLKYARICEIVDNSEE